MFTTPRMILNRSLSNAEPRSVPSVRRGVITHRDAGLKIPTFRLQAGGKSTLDHGSADDRPCTQWIRIGHRRCEHTFVVREPRPTRLIGLAHGGSG